MNCDVYIFWTGLQFDPSMLIMDDDWFTVTIFWFFKRIANSKPSKMNLEDFNDTRLESVSIWNPFGVSQISFKISDNPWRKVLENRSTEMKENIKVLKFDMLKLVSNCNCISLETKKNALKIEDHPSSRSDPKK